MIKIFDRLRMLSSELRVRKSLLYLQGYCDLHMVWNQDKQIQLRKNQLLTSITDGTDIE